MRGNGDILFATSGAGFPRALLGPAANRGAEEGRLQVWDDAGHAYRGMRESVRVPLPGEAPAMVAVALNIDHHRAFLRDFRRTLWIAIAASAALMALLAWAAARRGLRPVRAIADVTRGVSPTRLGDRIPVDTLPLELAGLGAA